MASFKQYTASGGASENFSIKTAAKEEINVRVDGVLKTAGTHYNITNYTSNGGTVTWITSPSDHTPSSGTVRIYRLTGLTAQATYQTGAAVKANDLNDNQTQALRLSEESSSRTDNLVQNWDLEPDAVTTDKIKDETIVNANISPTAEIAVSKLQDGSARQLLQTASNGSDVEWATNIDIPGTLDVTGVTTLDTTLNVSGATNLQATGVDGNFDVNSNKFTVTASNGNTAVGGTLNVTGTAGFSDAVGVDGNFDVNTNKFTVAASSGNTVVAGTLNVTGTITGNVTGDLTGKASQLADAASVTSSEQAGHTADNSTYYTSAASDARYYNIGSTEEIISSETWVSDDTSIATTKAVDNRVINLVDEVGGFVPITDESDFPATNPDINSNAGTIVSIGTLTTSYTPSTGTVTIPASTLDNLSNDLTITGCGSTVLAAGFGVLVETKALSDAAYAANPSYTFHRLTPKSSEVTTVAGISSNITTVAGISSNVTTVAGISSDVTAVAGKTTEIGRLGTADAVSDMNTLGTADVVSDLNTLGTADVVSDMNTLATTANVNNMSTVAGIAANVTTVAGISSNVTTVAGKGADVTAVAGKITEVETVADNLTAVENFNDTYQIDDFSPSAPTTDGGGNALAEGDLAYDTTNDKLKVWTGSAWETGVEGHTNLMARAGGTFTGDVTWDNSTNAGKDMFWDESDDTLKLNDDVQISLGSDRDIRLYHTGTHGYINVVTGNLNIRTNGTEEAIVAKKDGAVELYYDGSQKVATTSGGINVTGTTTDDGADHAGDVIFQGDGANSYWDKSNDSLIFNDNAGVNLGTGRDVRFYFDGNHTYLNVVDGDLNIRTSGTESAIVCTKDAGVATYHNGVKKTETTSAGLDITGNITISGTVDGIDIATDVAANTAKVTNATHTGDVTGATSLTIANNAVNLDKMAGIARGALITGDASGDPKYLAVGSDNYVLTVDSNGDIGWEAAAAGGISDVVDDTSPQLGGNLDIQARTITTSTTDGNIALVPNGAGVVTVGNSSTAVSTLKPASGKAMQVQASHAYTKFGDGGNGSVTIAAFGTGEIELHGGDSGMTNLHGSSASVATLTTHHTCDLLLETNDGSNSGTIKIEDGADNDILITPNGTGDLILDGLKWPQADGTANYVLKTDGGAQLSWVEMSAGVTSDGQNNTTAGSGAGAALDADTYRNTLFGKDAGNDINASDDCVFIGYQCGDGVTSTGKSVAIGSQAMSAAAGERNTFIGFDSGRYSTGELNVGIGAYTLSDGSSTGDNCVAIGDSALNALESGDSNVAIGQNAGGTVTTGAWNILVGGGTGGSLNTGSNNTIIGPSAGATIASGSDNIYIGRLATATAADSANECVIGNANGSNGEITKFKIPGCNFSLKETTATDNYVLTVDSNGDCGWEAAGGAALTGSTNNTITTVTGANAIQGEANLTFDGSTLAVTGNQTVSKQISAVGFEAPAEVAADWSIAAANNAMYPGPMTVASGVAITVPANRTLTIV